MTRTLSALLALALVACDGGSTAPDSGPSDARAAVPVGGACASAEECIAGASCFEHQGAALTPVCMADCDLDDTRLCGDGAVCTRATGPDRPADLGVCYLGGTITEGSLCTNNLECERGTICVIAGAAQACFAACTVGDDSPCASGETCLMLGATGADGYCAP